MKTVRQMLKAQSPTQRLHPLPHQPRKKIYLPILKYFYPAESLSFSSFPSSPTLGSALTPAFTPFGVIERELMTGVADKSEGRAKVDKMGRRYYFGTGMVTEWWHVREEFRSASYIAGAVSPNFPSTQWWADVDTYLFVDFRWFTTAFAFC